jgi:hypothetical protein
MIKPASSTGSTFRKLSASPWDGSIGRLCVGIEEEVFVLRGGIPAPLKEVRSIFHDILSQGFHTAHSDGQGLPVQVNLELRNGYVAVKNDYCSHILEIAFPPENDPTQFAAIYEDVWSTVSNAAKSRGFELVRKGYLPLEPVELLYTERTDWFVNRTLGQKPYADRHFGSKICAAQTHFNILSDSFYSSLSRLYSLEYLFPLAFSSSATVHDGRKVRCIRPLIYRDNFPENYGPVGVPLEIPTSAKEYADFLAKSSHQVKRDYTFIAPRPFGSVEFRSACVQPNLDKLLEVVALRAASIEICTNEIGRSKNDSYELFYDVCEGSLPAKEKLDFDLERLSLANQTKDSVWSDYLSKALKSVAAAITEASVGAV